jgi:hypothetical protein
VAEATKAARTAMVSPKATSPSLQGHRDLGRCRGRCLGRCRGGGVDMVHCPGSTSLQGLHGPPPMSVVSSYPVTPLAAFGLSGAFDKWDAINAPTLSQPVQACRPCQSMPAWSPLGGRSMAVAWSTFGPQPIGTHRSPAVSSGRSFAQVPGTILR